MKVIKKVTKSYLAEAIDPMDTAIMIIIITRFRMEARFEENVSMNQPWSTPPATSPNPKEIIAMRAF